MPSSCCAARTATRGVGAQASRMAREMLTWLASAGRQHSPHRGSPAPGRAPKMPARLQDLRLQLDTPPHQFTFSCQNPRCTASCAPYYNTCPRAQQLAVTCVRGCIMDAQNDWYRLQRPTLLTSGLIARAVCQSCMQRSDRRCTKARTLVASSATSSAGVRLGIPSQLNLTRTQNQILRNNPQAVSLANPCPEWATAAWVSAPRDRCAPRRQCNAQPSVSLFWGCTIADASRGDRYLSIPSGRWFTAAHPLRKPSRIQRSLSQAVRVLALGY